MTVAHWLCGISLVWLAYVWIGYPLALLVLSLMARFRPITAADHYPMVSVLIAARNEGKDIGWKLVETLNWDYPADRLEVLVGSDASTDGTDDSIRSLRSPRLTFIRNEERLGKSRTLNRLARVARGEILFFTDANTHIEALCLRRMIRYFSDRRVGCVTGLERNVTADEASAITIGASTYLEYEAAIDILESRLGSVLVCDGSIYCLRRSLFFPLDPDIANDLEHPIRAGASGAAILFEPQARSFERCTTSTQEEFSRRRRIAAQGALAMWRLRRELRGLRLWQFVSRKFLRWTMVIPAATLFIASFALRHEPWFAALWIMQAAFYLVALTGVWQSGASGAKALFRVPFIVVMAHAAVFIGVVDACRGKTFATWNIAGLSRGVAGHPK